MIETFLLSRKLSRAYTANSFIYYLKSFPIIRRFVSYDSYKGGIIKTLSKIYSLLNDVFTFCIAEFLYIGALYLASIGISSSGVMLDRNEVFTNVFFIFMLVGIALNSVLFEATKDKYYAIMILRMNAKNFVLSDMLYKLIRKFIGNTLAFIPVVLLGKLDVKLAVVFVLTTVIGKFLGAFVRMKFIEKNKLQVFSTSMLIAVIVLFLICGLSIYKSISIPTGFIFAICLLVLAVSLFCAYKVLTYKKYRNICRYFLTEDTVFAANAAKNKADTTKKTASSAITFDEKDSEEVSKKSGYAFFHELFVKRHKKLLWKRTKIISIVIAAFGAGLVATFAVLRFAFGVELSFGITRLIFLLPFAFYFINTGDTLASAMFANCDAAMLSYNFYRKPKVILGTFRQRLKTVVALNIIPAVLIAVVLSGVCAFSADSGNNLSYVAIWITCIALSVFFSIHRLVIYYLLQPFTEGLESKRASYSIANAVTYFVSYELMQLSGEAQITPIVFGLIATLFSIVYIGVSLLLVYKFAPKRFRVHK